MERNIVIGLDCGTQSAKAGAWDREGRLLARASRPLGLATPREGWAEQDPAAWWTSARDALREVASGIDAKRLAGLGLAFQRESFTLASEDGTVLRPGILWLDVRAVEETDELGRAAGPGETVDITHAAPRLLWLARHEPAVVERARRWVDVGSFLMGKLADRSATCRAGADTSGLVDVVSGRWRRERLAAIGCGQLALPQLVGPGEVVGPLGSRAAVETGLPEGVPVVAGGGDGQVLRVGLGAGAETPWSLTLGTSIVLGLASATPDCSPAWRTLSAAEPAGGFVREAVLQSGGYAVQWLEGLLGRTPEDRLAAIPAGSDGLITLPHLWGARFPAPLADGRGAILGLSHQHTASHLQRSLLEGISFELRRLAEAMAAGPRGLAQGGPLLASGGGTRNRLWLAILAAVLGRPVALPEDPDAVALGAAVLTALATGCHPTVTAAQAAMVRLESPVTPEPAALERYDTLFRTSYLPALERVLPVTADVHRLTGG